MTVLLAGSSRVAQVTINERVALWGLGVVEGNMRWMEMMVLE